MASIRRKARRIEGPLRQPLRLQTLDCSPRPWPQNIATLSPSISKLSALLLIRCVSFSRAICIHSAGLHQAGVLNITVTTRRIREHAVPVDVECALSPFFLMASFPKLVARIAAATRKCPQRACAAIAGAHLACRTALAIHSREDKLCCRQTALHNARS